MPVSSEFVAYVVELLEGFGPAEAKRMFGGYGIYLDGLMFGIVANDTLYFKADETNRPDFEAEGCPPFTYTRQGKELALSYFQAPDDAMDNAEDLCRWAAGAHAAAVRNAKPRKKRKKKK